MGGMLRLTQISASISDSLGGPSRVVKDSHSYLSNHFDAKLLVVGESGEGEKIIKIPVFFDNRYGVPKFILNRSIPRILKQSDIILIHGFFTMATLFALFYGPKSAKYFLMPHGSLEIYQHTNQKFLKAIFSKIFLYLINGKQFMFIVATDSEKTGVRSHFPDLEIQTIGLGVAYSGLPSVRDQIQSPLKLVCISRISPKKRIDLCILALKLLLDEDIDAELHIAGVGDAILANSLKKLVSDSGLIEHVYFYGHLDRQQISELLPKMHMFLLPSENENFAIAVGEAICDGLPTVVSNQVALQEFVLRHSTGVVITELNPEALKDAILETKQNLRTFSLNAINSSSELSWSVIIKRWVQVLCS